MNLIPVENTENHYRVCKTWLENRDITKWLTSILRFSKYSRLIHEMLITNRRNRLFFISVENKSIGLIGLSNIDLVDRRAEIWFLIGEKSYRNKNYASDAVNLLKEIAVKDLKLVTLYAHVCELNVSSMRLLEKTGFKYAGRFRKGFFIDGEYKNFLIYDWVNPQIDQNPN
jgi:ribosomal-protein-alanine N-acetyltransferase